MENNINQDKKKEEKENNLEEKENIVKEKENNLEEKENNLEGKENKLEGKENKLEGKENNLEGKENKLEGKENRLEGKENNLEEKENIVKEKVEVNQGENQEEKIIIENQSIINKIIESNEITNEKNNIKNKERMDDNKINVVDQKKKTNDENKINKSEIILEDLEDKSNENNEENQKKKNKPKNCGHNKMKRIYEEIKAGALENSKKIKEEQKYGKKNEENNKNSISNFDNFENNYIDITEDAGIKTKIIKKGNGENKPSEGKAVFIYFKSKYGDKIFDQSLENEPFQFIIGENKVIKGWEIALKTMAIGEKSEFIMTPEYTYGDKQVKDWIPPNSILNYEIELIAIGNNNTENCLENMTYEEKLQWGKLLKAEGVEKFKKDDIIGARECFMKALPFLKKIDPKNEEEKEGVDLFLAIICNICNCYNKEKEYNSVIEFANLGIEIKPMPKLLYFRAIAFAFNEEFENSNNDLNTLSNLFLEATGNERKYIEQALDYLKPILDKRKQIFIEKNKKYSRSIFRQYLYYDKSLNHKPLLPPIEINPENPIVFFEIKIGEKNIGKIEFELFKDVAPKTAENFRCLCNGNNDEMTYKGTYLNKIIKNFVIGGGELNNNSRNKKCIYGEYFDDENYIYCHCRRGLLTMDNEGKNTNNSKFLITLKYIPWFDGKHVVFGQIIEGMEIIKEIEELETDNEDRPLNNVIIENCGEIFKKDISAVKEENIKEEDKEKEGIEDIIKKEENIKNENKEKEEIIKEKAKCEKDEDIIKESEDIKIEENPISKNENENKMEENKESKEEGNKIIKIDEEKDNKIEECINEGNKRIIIEENKEIKEIEIEENKVFKKEENEEIVKKEENEELKIKEKDVELKIEEKKKYKEEGNLLKSIKEKLKTFKNNNNN